MRISDWSSDVCSSDLLENGMLTPLDGIENRLHLGHARLRILFDESEDDIVLVLEQSINLADADRCLSGEFGSGRRMESFGIEQFACCLDYPLSWRFRSRSEEHTSELQSLMRISYA